MKRVKLFVAPYKDRGWRLREPDPNANMLQSFLQPLGLGVIDTFFHSQELAVAAGQAAAYKLVGEGSKVSLYIAKANGRVREERTYPRSADPVKTKG